MSRLCLREECHLFFVLLNDLLNQLIDLRNYNFLDNFDPEFFLKESSIHCEELAERLNRRLSKLIVTFICQNNQFTEDTLP